MTALQYVSLGYTLPMVSRGPKTDRLLLRLTPELNQRLADAAARHRRSKSDLIRVVLEDWLDTDEASPGAGSD